MKNIKNTKHFWLFMLIAISCKSYDEFDFKKVKFSQIDTTKEIHLMNSKWDIVDCFEFEGNEIDYCIGFNDSNNINTIYTFDEKFVTPDGLSIGDTFYEAKKRAIKVSHIYGHTICEINSGWKAVFYPDSTFSDSTKIMMFEKWASDIYTD